MSIAPITVPSTSSCLTTGEARASGALRAAGPLQALRTADHDVASYGDVVIAPPTPQQDSQTRQISIAVSPSAMASVQLGR